VDPGLVRNAQRGDAFALDELIDALYPLVRRISRRIAGKQADDAAQEALLAIFRDLPKLRAPEAVISWASAVTARTAARIDHVDRRQHGQASMADSEALSPGVDFDALELADVLARLPARDHAVLVLSDLQGLSDRDIAEALGVPVGTVKSRLHRARRRFREEWSR
jgi:RNA polymerase sigma-70 factor (ECF subfamily)